MTSLTNGQNMRTFFNQTIQGRDECNCPENPQVSKSFVLDLTANKEELFWIDPWVQQIVASDMKGCRCRVIVDATQGALFGKN